MALAFLDRDRSLAPAGYSRWLVPPAALAIHLSIGQVYAFSVFKNPLLALHAADGSAWNLKEIGYIFSIAIAVLGISAALFGAWLEKAGPRRAMFYAAVLLRRRLLPRLLRRLGSHQLWPASTSATASSAASGSAWATSPPFRRSLNGFPDRPGLATGLAIMGFGGGAMIGGPLANQLMAALQIRTASPPSPTP